MHDKNSPQQTAPPGVHRDKMYARTYALAALENDIRGAAPQGKKLVFGEGSPAAGLALVGEAPGGQEERIGRPFVGPAGRLLDGLLAEVSLPRKDLWITNVVKWHPKALRDGREQTVAPSASEVQMCRGWLEKELAIIAPALVVCLGNLSARVLIHSRFQMLAGHGRWDQSTLGVPAMATFHPAYALRAGSRLAEIRQMMLGDLLKVKDRYDHIIAAVAEAL